MAREELLNDEQAAVVRQAVQGLKDRLNTQADVAKVMGVSQQTISRILDPRKPVGLYAAVQVIQSGHLDVFAVFGNAPSERLARVADLLALPVQVVVSAWDAAGKAAGGDDTVRRLPETIQRAALAVVYLDNRNMAETYRAAQEALDDLGLDYAPRAVDAWLQPIRDRLPRRTSSGVRPSVPAMKIDSRN